MSSTKSHGTGSAKSHEAGKRRCCFDIIYVNIDNRCGRHSDGSSWKHAFKSLQEALDVSATRNKSEIWVAKGTYLPSEVYSPNGIPGGASGQNVLAMKTFNIPDGVSIYGGFKGDECRRDESNPRCNHTVLGGANTFWHVVTFGNDVAQTGVKASLNGLVIGQGNAKGPNSAPDTITTPFGYTHSNGGGLYVTYGSRAILTNCLVEENQANGIGGGIFCINSDLQLVRSHVNNNFAGQQAGGLAVYNTYETTSHHSLVKDCHFKGNNALLFGGAAVIEGTLPDARTKCHILKTVFEHNHAYEGGAVVVDSETTHIDCCKFVENTAYVNAGALATTNVVNAIAAAIQTPPIAATKYWTTVTNTSFERNQAMGNVEIHDSMFGGPALGLNFPLGGGATTCYMNGLLKIRKCTFDHNTGYNSNGGAHLNGGSAGSNIFGIPGLNVFQATTKIKNSTFNENYSDKNGGAIASLPNDYPFIPPVPITPADIVLEVSNSEFNRNTAQLRGGAIYLDSNTTAVLKCNTYHGNKSCTGGEKNVATTV